MVRIKEMRVGNKYRTLMVEVACKNKSGTLKIKKKET